MRIFLRTMAVICTILISNLAAQPFPEGQILIHGQAILDSHSQWTGLWTLDILSGTLTRLIEDSSETTYECPKYTARGKLLAVATQGKHTGKEVHTLVSMEHSTQKVGGEALGRYLDLVPLHSLIGWQSSCIWDHRGASFAYPVVGGLHKLDVSTWRDDELLTYGALDFRHREMYIPRSWDWSPDGSRIYIPMEDGQVHRFDLQARTSAPVTRGIAVRAAPSGNSLAVMTAIAERERDFPNSITVVDDEGNERALYAAGEGEYIQSFVWSPDSAYLAVLETRPPESWFGKSSDRFLKIIKVATRRVVADHRLKLSNVGPLEDWGYWY